MRSFIRFYDSASGACAQGLCLTASVGNLSGHRTSHIQRAVWSRLWRSGLSRLQVSRPAWGRGRQGPKPGRAHRSRPIPALLRPDWRCACSRRGRQSLPSSRAHLSWWCARLGTMSPVTRTPPPGSKAIIHVLRCLLPTVCAREQCVRMSAVHGCKRWQSDRVLASMLSL